jgi:bifunctional DNA-binding transcriptional regulator/antitoxin component of YhaV-PrlF toxin-antitoxin module
MATLVKIHHNGQLTLPMRLRTQAGILEGDLVEAAFHRGKIVLSPTLAIDRSKFSNADDDYTPEQRRVIDARLAESAEELKRGRTFGPFKTAEEMIASMKAQLRRRSAVKKAKLSR